MNSLTGSEREGSYPVLLTNQIKNASKALVLKEKINRKKKKNAKCSGWENSSGSKSTYGKISRYFLSPTQRGYHFSKSTSPKWQIQKKNTVAKYKFFISICIFFVCSQRKDYSNSLTLYLFPDITSRTFQTCHDWTWGVCSLDFIQCQLTNPCFQHAGLRLESLGDLYSCAVALTPNRPQMLKTDSTRCLRSHWTRPTSCRLSGMIFSATLEGDSRWGLILERNYPRIRGLMLPGPWPFQSYSCFDFFPCRVSFWLCECHTIKLKCALREESEIFC